MASLRQRMLEDMQVRRLSACTQRTYVETVARFARYFDRSPARLGPEQIRAYQVYLTNERRLAPSSLVVAVSALRFLYRVTLQKRWVFDDMIPAPKKTAVPTGRAQPGRSGSVSRRGESREASRHPDRVLRRRSAHLPEAVHLTVSAIDSERMVLRIAKGKGQKDRYVMLSPKLLAILRAWWKVDRPRHWLFPGERPETPITRGAVQRACQNRRPTRAPRQSGFATFAPPCVLPSICSRPAPTCAPSSSCSGIGVWRPRRSTCGSRPPRSARPRVRWICSHGPSQNAPRSSTELLSCHAPCSPWRRCSAATAIPSGPKSEPPSRRRTAA